MNKLEKIEINFEELIFGIHKSFLAIHFLEENKIEEAKKVLLFSLSRFNDFLKQKKQSEWIAIAYEIVTNTECEQGENWFVNNPFTKEVSIVRQLVPLKEYATLVADALYSLQIWNDKITAKRQLESALRTLSYEVQTLSL